jgi:sulfonate transport system ATP-binding protein
MRRMILRLSFLIFRTPSSPVAEVVYLEGVWKSFGSLAVLQGVDFTLDEGEFVCVVGRSGCGKSTFLRIIAGLLEAGRGIVRAEGPAAIGFQEPRLAPWLRVEKNVRLGMKGPADALRKEALRALAAVGLTEKAACWPRELSGGQAQRVSLARALVRRPRLLLLDEPLSALDAFTRREMQDLLARLAREYALSVVMVTHDEEEARRLADRVLTLEEGKFALEMTPGAENRA